MSERLGRPRGQPPSPAQSHKSSVITTAARTQPAIMSFRPCFPLGLARRPQHRPSVGCRSMKVVVKEKVSSSQEKEGESSGPCSRDAGEEMQEVLDRRSEWRWAAKRNAARERRLEDRVAAGEKSRCRRPSRRSAGKVVLPSLPYVPLPNFRFSQLLRFSPPSAFLTVTAGALSDVLRSMLLRGAGGDWGAWAAGPWGAGAP